MKLAIQCGHVLELAVHLQVLLATCFDDSQLEALKGAKGQYVRLDQDPVGNISATAMDVPQGRISCILPTVLMSQHHATIDDIGKEVYSLLTSHHSDPACIFTIAHDSCFYCTLHVKDKGLCHLLPSDLPVQQSEQACRQ